ncbi:aldo/keto reductase [Parvularcula dongshanensis]|uniref:Putative oxidoreductase n=1 Tax=Parvularcula dongshanensis TaxID=1173995 RepID=A0A840I6S3_9PROT|nr:aldo/keto reductase [Parvularcula dongshanensis]MBB4659943.1 putative oxidoreductase [Parvularcula dongshanensis]
MTKHTLAYGFWRYGPGEAETAMRMVDTARSLGITHLDTADVYGGGEFGAAEVLLGEIRDRDPRFLDGLEVATKAGVEFGTPYNNSKDYLTRACDESLRRMKAERVDLFYVHRPDFLAHPAEVADALDGLVSSGKVGRVGVSNYTVEQVRALKAHLKAPLTAQQVEFSVLEPAPLYDGTADQAMAMGLDLFAWSPLGGGRVPTGEGERAARVRPVLERLANEAGISVSAASLSFLLAHPSGVVPIIGTTKEERLRDAARASELKLTRRQWYEVLEASLGERLP